MSKHSLTAAAPGVVGIWVDDVEIRVGGDPVDLTADQADRVRAITGVQLEAAGTSAPKPRKARAKRAAKPSSSTSTDPGGSPAPTERNDPS